MSAYQIPSDATTLWKITYVAFAIATRPIFRLQVEGREKVPRTGGAVVVCNHPGGVDYIALGLASPRQLYYMAKVELFQIHPWLSAYLRAAGAFPVRRGQRDVHAIQEAVDVVRSGKVLGMFPEGTRSRGGALKRGKSGAARVAMAAQVPIVPAGVIGAYEAPKRFYRQLRRPLVTVRFGEPFLPQGRVENPDDVHANVEQMMRRIAGLLPPEMRGLYAHQPENSPIPRA